LVDLVDRGLIRVLDFAFVRKEDDGTVVGSTSTSSATTPA
jgi:hypothetical protein